MRLIILLLAASLLSSCALLKVPGRTIKSLGRTFGVSTKDSSTPGRVVPTQPSHAISFGKGLKE